MPRTITIEDAAENLASSVEDISRTGEPLVVTRGGKPVAEIRPAGKVSTVEDFLAFLAEGPHLTPEEAEDFARDLEAIRALDVPQVPKDPWQS